MSREPWFAKLPRLQPSASTVARAEGLRRKIRNESADAESAVEFAGSVPVV